MATLVLPEAGADDPMRLTVSYDGPELASGRMDLRYLAPAMLSTAKLLEHTAQELYGTTATLKIDVQADFRRGSFSYEIVTQAASLGRTLLDHITISDVIVSADAVLRLIKAARGQTPASVERSDSAAKITFNDGNNITINVQTLNLYQNRTVRADAEGIVEPLTKSGITGFKMTTPVSEPLEVTSDEVSYFAAPIQESDLLSDTVTTMVVEILAPDFKRGNKWKFSLAGAGVIWADILDEQFGREVAEHRQTFGAGDAFRVEMHTIVTRSPQGSLQRKDEIVRVLEKIPHVERLPLFPE